MLRRIARAAGANGNQIALMFRADCHVIFDFKVGVDNVRVGIDPQIVEAEGARERGGALLLTCAPDNRRTAGRRDIGTFVLGRYFNARRFDEAGVDDRCLDSILDEIDRHRGRHADAGRRWGQIGAKNFLCLERHIGRHCRLVGCCAN